MYDHQAGSGSRLFVCLAGFLRIHHRPALDNTVVLTRRLYTGVRQMEGKEKKAATHHTPRHEGKQGRAGQSSTRKTLKKIVQVPKRVRPCMAGYWLALRRRSGRRRRRSFAFGGETWAEIGSRLRPFLVGEISGEWREKENKWSRR